MHMLYAYVVYYVLNIEPLFSQFKNSKPILCIAWGLFPHTLQLVLGKPDGSGSPANRTSIGANSTPEAGFAFANDPSIKKQPNEIFLFGALELTKSWR